MGRASWSLERRKASGVRTASFSMALVVVLGTLSACSDAATGPGADRREPISLPGVTVSEAIPGTAGGPAGASAPSEVAYIALPPGTLSGIESVTIRNLTAGSPATAPIPVVDGGFDPVAVPADPGDELEIELLGAGGWVGVARMVVPTRRPPTIVRTSPPRGRTDVALSTRLVVVFSEPVDPGTVTPESIRLSAGGAPVSGRVALRPGEPWIAELVPATDLEPGTDHVLEITTGVHDLHGDALEAPFSVTFLTSASALPRLEGRIAFVSDRDGTTAIYVANADGTGLERLTEGEAPAWSWDGRRIAFHRGEGPSGPAGIYVMDADGSDVRWLREGWHPAWSPDDSRIAFNTGVGEGGGLHVMTAAGTGAQKLVSDDFEDAGKAGYDWGHVQTPAWSPDGGSIAFVRASYGDPWAVWVIELDGSGLRNLSDASDGEDATWRADEPAWSPDGSTIAAVSSDFDGGRLTTVLAGYPADASGEREILHRLPSRYAGSPDWSPDGRHLVFDRFASPGATEESPLGSRIRIFLLDIETGEVRQLVPDALDPVRTDYGDGQPAWSRAR